MLREPVVRAEIGVAVLGGNPKCVIGACNVSDSRKVRADSALPMLLIPRIPFLQQGPALEIFLFVFRGEIEVDSNGSFISLRIDFLGDVDVHAASIEVVVNGDEFRFFNVAGDASRPFPLHEFAPVQLHLDLFLRGASENVISESSKVEAGYGTSTVAAGWGRGLRFSDESQPEDIEPSTPDGEGNVIAFNVESHGLPAGPRSILESPVEVFVRMSVGAAEDVKRAMAGAGGVLIKVGSDNIEAAADVEPLEIVEERFLDAEAPVRGDSVGEP